MLFRSWTPLHYAVVHRNRQLVTALCNIISGNKRRAPQDFYGRTPLHYIYLFKNDPLDDVVSYIRRLSWMENCADKDWRGMTPLHWYTSVGNHNAVHAFLSNTSDRMQIPKECDLAGRYLSHWAALGGSCRILELLKDKDLINTTKDSYGYTPLDIAIQQGNKEAEEWLSENYPDLKHEREQKQAKPRGFL